jgi:hypothetical protein
VDGEGHGCCHVALVRRRGAGRKPDATFRPRILKARRGRAT